MEKVFVVGASLKGADCDISEIMRLVETAGGEITGKKIFKISRINPAFYIGRGQAESLAWDVAYCHANTVVFDFPLKPNQQRNLEEMISAKILDRTGVVLDIFARHARSEDGKNQVELAQLEYLLPRLTGRGISLMQQVGGIGVRGPGERKLEYDRRRIRNRIDLLKKKLKNLARRREIQRKKRISSEVPIISICGYTNSGKTTLFNAFTGAGAVAEDRLFQTLDPLVRKARIFDRDMLFTDTVGFIKNLPPQIINAFHSTLEEVAYASLLLVVMDVSKPQWEEELEVVSRTLDELGLSEIPSIFVANKIDLGIYGRLRKDMIPISALKKEGLEELRQKIYEKFI